MPVPCNRLASFFQVDGLVHNEVAGVITPNQEVKFVVSFDLFFTKQLNVFNLVECIGRFFYKHNICVQYGF